MQPVLEPPFINAVSDMIGSVQPMASVSIREITSQEEFAELQEVWNTLLERSKDRNPFLTWEWLYTWWKHFGAAGRLNILLFEADGRTLGIAPLMRLRKRFGPITVDSLENVGRGMCDYGGVILAEREEECVSALLSYVTELARKKGIIWRMSQIPAESQFLALLSARVADQNGLVLSLGRGSPCPYITLQGSWDSYYKTLRRKRRGNLRRAMTNLAEAHDVNISVRDSQRDSAETFEALLEFYDQKWGAKDGQREFFKELFYLLEQSGWGTSSSIRVDGKIASAVFGIEYAGKYHYWRPGFDPEFSKYSLGQNQILSLIQEAFARDCREYDLLKGDLDYKFTWANAVRENVGIVAHGSGVIPRMKLNILQQLPRVGRIAQRGISGNIRFLKKRLRTKDRHASDHPDQLQRDRTNVEAGAQPGEDE